MSNSRTPSATSAYQQALKLAIERSKEDLRVDSQREYRNSYRFYSRLSHRSEAETNKLNADPIYNHQVFNSIKI